ncbi:ABC transporter permease [Mycoplasma struthionis]|uniref:ABC transporter permease subunit n=1 Tax=Mycoplasma struthionis TaxID=538220 RepID=A0A3G8LGJ0_9MOLU|nr:ABC transporter permease subunit [Mycoplasma struthionis]AZG68789.1 ABC transporter permease subunit [Mycoplasma struthionis]
MPKNLYSFVKKQKQLQDYVIHQKESKLFWKRFFRKKSNIAIFSLFLITLFTLIFALLFIKNSPVISINSDSIYVNNLPPYFAPIVTKNFVRGQELDFIRNIATLEEKRAFEANQNPVFKILYDSAFETGGPLTVHTDIVILQYNAYDLLKAINLNSISLNNNINFSNIYLGTNSNGIDLYSRTLSSIFVSILIVLVAVFINIFTGFILASIYVFNKNKWYAKIIDQVATILNSIPEIIWIFLLCIFLSSNWYGIIISFSLISWISYYEISKNELLSLQNSDFILAYKAIGLNKSQIIFKHMLKRIFPSLLVSVVERFAINIIIISSLAFLNMIKQDNDLNLGVILKESIDIVTSNPLPLIIITIYLLTFLIELKLLNLSFSATLFPNLK